jgi:uncharacterized protein
MTPRLAIAAAVVALCLSSVACEEATPQGDPSAAPSGTTTPTMSATSPVSSPRPDAKCRDVLGFAVAGETEKLIRHAECFNEDSGNLGRRAMLASAIVGRPASVSALASLGVSPNGQDENGVSALHAVTGVAEDDESILPQRRRLATVKALVKAGADLDVRDVGGATPLHYTAGRVGSPLITAYLLSVGADRTIRDKHGRTPLDLALESGNPEVIAILDG